MDLQVGDQQRPRFPKLIVPVRFPVTRSTKKPKVSGPLVMATLGLRRKALPR